MEFDPKNPTAKDGKAQKGRPPKDQSYGMRLHLAGRALFGGRSGMCPETSVRFGTLVDCKKQRKLIRLLDNGIVRLSSESELEAEIAKYLVEDLGSVYDCHKWYKQSDLALVKKVVLDQSPSFNEEEILGIAQKSYEGLSYHKLDFDFLPENIGETPTFDLLFAQMKANAAAARMFIGSIFDPDSDRSQYLFLKGDGNDGKGTLIGVLVRALGPSVSMATAPNDQDRFWLGHHYNKRLVILSDVNNFKVVSTSQIKTLTGDDHVCVEEKNKPLFVGKAIAKLIFASNYSPDVVKAEHDRRRLIYVPMDTVPPEQRIGKRIMEARLQSELKAFLTKCWFEYRENCKEGGIIPTESVVFDALADMNEMDFVDIVDKYMVVDPDLGIQLQEIKHMNQSWGLEPKALYAFRKWLIRMYKLERKSGYREKKDREDPDNFEPKVLPTALYGIGWKKEKRLEVPLRPNWSKRSKLEWQSFLKSPPYDSTPKKETKRPVDKSVENSPNHADGI